MSSVLDPTYVPLRDSVNLLITLLPKRVVVGDLRVLQKAELWSRASHAGVLRHT